MQKEGTPSLEEEDVVKPAPQGTAESRALRQSFQTVR